MEFSFDVSDILPEQISTVDGYYLLSPKDEEVEKHQLSYESHPLWYQSKPDDRITDIIDSLGEASAKAQGLQSPVTTTSKLMHSNQRMYVIKDMESRKNRSVIIGMIKVGKKELLLMNHDEQYHKVTPLCLLDFYIHELRQRRGYGYRLFEHMLKVENIRPEYLAVDRPSEMLTAFLKKYYKLEGGIHQSNNFVTYPGFFQQFADSDGKLSPIASHKLQDIRDALQQAEERFEREEAKMAFWLPERPLQSKEEGENSSAGSPIKRPRSSPSEEADLEHCSSWRVMGVPPPSYLFSSSHAE